MKNWDFPALSLRPSGQRGNLRQASSDTFVPQDSTPLCSDLTQGWAPLLPTVSVPPRCPPGTALTVGWEAGSAITLPSAFRGDIPQEECASLPQGLSPSILGEAFPGHESCSSTWPALFSLGPLSPTDVDLCAVRLSPAIDEDANSSDFVIFVQLSPQL